MSFIRSSAARAKNAKGAKENQMPRRSRAEIGKGQGQERGLGNGLVIGGLAARSVPSEQPRSVPSKQPMREINYGLDEVGYGYV